MSLSGTGKSRSSVVTFLILLGGFFIFLLILLPPASRSPFYNDDYYSFLQIKDLATNPWAAWAKDEDGRRHPLWFYLLFVEKNLFGVNITGYFLVHFWVHFVNALLVAGLCRRLFNNTGAGILSGLLFLFSSSYYQVFVWLQAGRPLALMLVLMAALAWIDYLRQGRARSVLGAGALGGAALLANESAVTWPLAALFLGFWIKPRQAKGRWVLLSPLAVFFLLAFLWCFFVFRGSAGTILRSASLAVPDGATVFAKILSLIEMFVRPLLLPEKGFLPPAFLPETFLRLLPAILLLVPLLVFLSRKGRFKLLWEGIPKRLFLFSLAWIGITVLPFMFDVRLFEHTSRYLYFPGVGFSILAGLTAAHFLEICRSESSRSGIILGLVILVYVLILNGYSNAYHFQRYKDFTDKVEWADYTERVHELLRAR